MTEAAPQAATGSTGEDIPDQLTSAALAALRFGWGEAYLINWDPERGWWARRRDSIGGDITAEDADGLWNAMRVDYDLKPVPRGADSVNVDQGTQK